MSFPVLRLFSPRLKMAQNRGWYEELRLPYECHHNHKSDPFDRLSVLPPEAQVRLAGRSL